MHFSKHLGFALTAVAFYAQRCRAQSPVMYTDPSTKITFPTWTDGKGYTFGLVVPDTALTTDTYEYIGYLSCTTPSGPGSAYCGLSHGQSGQMNQALLLVAWPHEDQVLTSFRFASGYTGPVPYTGNATLTVLASTVTDSSFEIVYRCEDCLAWDQDGAAGKVSTSSGSTVLGRAAADEAPGNPGCPSDITIPYHARSFGQYGVSFEKAATPSYSSYAALPPKQVKVAATCAAAVAPGNGTTPPPTSQPAGTATVACQSIPANKTWDYVVVGGGAGGIPMADKLSEAGHSVLLIEKGPASTGQWGGTLRPGWLNGTNLTRFDVPGLCNRIWSDSAGIACSDIDQMAGCVLGGGTSINAGLWWKPNPADWDENFPEGWRSSDLAEATERVFERIPGTWTPSMDGQLYMHQGYDMLASGLSASGWEYVVSNDVPDRKNRTFGHGQFMFSNGERGGPLATYLATAAARDVFTLWTDTAVDRIVRDGAHATGVEVSCSAASGYSGTVNLTPGTGRVIVSAGTFGTPKLLFRSGIGPADQLALVKASADGARMVANDSWIDLPVGFNLVEQMNTDVIISHPDVVFYNFDKAWDTPIPADRDAYLTNRTGILAQAAPNIGPMLWEEITGADGITRQLQWTSRVQGDSAATNSTHAMTMSQYLGRGQVSRGRATITSSLAMTVSEHPFLHDEGDRQAVIQGIRSVQEALAHVKGLQWVRPRANQSAEDYVDSLLVTANGRRSNHWMGTAKMGLDDGRAGSGGTAVVDTDAKVYGTDNIFVLDASIFPGQLTGNPSATIVIAAEHAAARILGLESSSNKTRKTRKIRGHGVAIPGR